MADEFDPLKQTEEKPVEELYANVNKTLLRNDDLLRPQHEMVSKLELNPTVTTAKATSSLEQNSKQGISHEFNSTNTSTEKKPTEDVYQRLNYMNSAPKIPIRSTNPFEEDIRKPPIPTEVIHRLPQENGRPISTQLETKPDTQSFDSQGFYGHDYNATASSSHEYYDEYYEGSSHKRRGITAALDRLVYRFPSLSIFYTPKAPDVSETYATEYEEEYVEQEVESNEAPKLVDASALARELTPDETVLNERYSNKLRTQIIPLQQNDRANPVDLALHHESYTIYSCDVGRSIVEIFDMYGKLQHTISDSTITKFQPTSIAVADDGTIILASHFHHRLHMYAPDYAPENETSLQNQAYADCYRFQQYKVGSPGHDLNQFHFPAGITIDYNDGYIYVCDRGNFRIKVIRPEGICERVIELHSYDPSEYNIAPLQVALQQIGDQCICITGKGDALCFVSRNAIGATYVEPFYVYDNDGLGLQGASGIAVDSEDRIFISDTGHHRIVICAPDGSYITHFGVEGDGAGELRRPCGIDITYDGTVVVTDGGNKRLQLFGSMREQAGEENSSSAKTPIGQNNS